jgi:hypothetical protein
MPTYRTDEDGRLFPSEEFESGWSISAQADKAGYQCTPRDKLETLEAYEAVEVLIRGPEAWPIDARSIGLPESLAARFSTVDDGSPAIAGNVTHAELAEIRAAVMQVLFHPNAGVPRGSVVWEGRDLWHGGSQAAAEDIVENGIDMSQSSGGYFGYAFYVADEEDLARSNYADFCGEEEG